MRRRWITSIAVLALLLGGAAPAALADGDPASDVLLGLNVYYPYTPTVSNALQAKLNAETTAAARQHFPLKVALIESPIDLGVIPELFGKPQKYADFLDQEISFEGPQPLLVVMADGYGERGLTPAAQTALASVRNPAGSGSDALAQAAVTAVAKLAEAEGHPLQSSSSGGGGSGSGSGSGQALLLVVLGLAAIATASALLVLRHRQAAARPRRAP
jgi:hypothetical protein